MLYPGYAAEDDYAGVERLLGSSVALPLVHTTPDDVAHTEDNLLAVGQPDELAAGWRQLAPHRPDAVMWACTSGSFVFGWDGARDQADTLASTADVPASSTSIAFVEAAHALGVRRVAVAATYPEGIAARFVEFLAAGGIEVVSFTSKDILQAADVGDLGREAVLELAASTAESGAADAEAVLLPDTALHTVAWLDAMEAAAGKPVLTANQVTAWEGLRLAGHHERAAGLGALFRLSPDRARA
ncbi:MAG: maleate cis-trans isomerase family protein [Streptosporangiales bacterium]